MVMKGLCTGLGDENGLAFGDFGEGSVSGAGIVKLGLRLLLPSPDMFSPKEVFFDAAAKGLSLAYAENPDPKKKNRTKFRGL